VSHRITVDTRCYPVPAVHKALYALSNLLDSEIHFAGPDCLAVALFAKGGDAIDLETSFRRLLADFTIQIQVNAETASVRQALVTAALAESLGVRAARSD
jgi:His-Xaa-Ser system protein HxsD